MKSLHAQKFVEYGLLALVLVAMSLVNSGCSNQEIVQGVSQSVSVLANPDRTAYIVYGALPTGEEAIAVVSQVTTENPDISAKIMGDASITIEITKNLAAKGWSVVPWNQLPGPVQIVVLAQAEELLGSMSVLRLAESVPLLMPIGVFEDILPGLPAGDCVIGKNQASCKL